MVEFKYIVENQANKTTRTKPHYHSCYELIYYFAGTGYNLYAKNTHPKQNKTLVYDTSLSKHTSRRFTLEANSYIIYDPYTIHNEKLLPPSDITAIVFSIPENHKIPLGIYKDHDNIVAKYITKIKKEYHNKQAGYQIAINALLSQIFVHILRQTSSSEKNENSIQQAVAYIDDYFMNHIDINSLAATIGYGVDHFRFLFKKYTGISPKQYIQNKRISFAKQQLKYTNLPINTIAENCGYEDYFQFSTYFKKTTTFSPSNYRKNTKKS